MSVFRASSRLFGRCGAPMLKPSTAARCLQHDTTRAMSAASAIPLARPTVVMSPNMAERMSRHVLENIDLMVCDMAGTTVQEGGLVYKILQKSMQDGGLEVPDAAMHAWHGAKKEDVIEHFARQSDIQDHQVVDKVIEIADVFTAAIDVAYFDEASTISHIEIDLASYFRQLKAAGIKVALDTGYPPNIQEGLVKRLGFDSIVDSYISSYDVKLGRPYPYMIHTLMERLEIENVKRVAKVGDSCRDMEMGRNAGCGLVVGVLSGADSLEELMGAGADLVVDVITSLPVPRKRARIAKMRLPDLS
jgi:phosphonatase-like hydrolase